MLQLGSVQYITSSLKPEKMTLTFSAINTDQEPPQQIKKCTDAVRNTRNSKWKMSGWEEGEKCSERGRNTKGLKDQKMKSGRWGVTQRRLGKN